MDQTARQAFEQNANFVKETIDATDFIRLVEWFSLRTFSGVDHACNVIYLKVMFQIRFRAPLQNRYMLLRDEISFKFETMQENGVCLEIYQKID